MKKIAKSIKKSSFPIAKEKVNSLYRKASGYIEQARKKIYRTVDIEMVKAYWCIGREIVMEEQEGKRKSDYGDYLISELSALLTKKYGRGFSISTLKDIRQFFVIYSDSPIGHAVRGRFEEKFSPNLSWIHYRALMRIPRNDIRKFYEIETEKNHWSGRELERQINSLLYERLAKSKDKKGLMRLSSKGQEINAAQDAIKEPFILEFLGLPESHRLVESKLEEALIDNLQHFLLELGKGFAFIARQKRLTLDGDHFYTDLVFYHVILKCYIIIDIKTRKLTHADLGQMQLYVNYFDQEIIMKGDNPTVGLILCTKKSDAMVKYTLGDKAKQIFASKYQLHLPTEKELEAELKREINEIQHKGSVNE
ncbi:MAG: PDDEXK nuclease domain-containing protein [Rhabdochlamydiaceae bacterium]|jgi:predicted nuclease of restriction endonuclease-like (RecB) superfamily